MLLSTTDGYRYQEIEEEYAGIKQRWLLVYSQQAYEREYKTLTKNIRKENEEEGKRLWHLSNQAFACEADALKAAAQFNRKLKYHKLQYEIKVKNYYCGKGRPGAAEKPAKQEYYVSGDLLIDSEAVRIAASRKGFFIIATNELNNKELTCEQMLSVYKAQGVSVERGFRFLKDPQFYAESLYLKLPQRIMALIMIMGLSLLIYSLAEKKLRKELANSELTVPDQKGKPTNKPTMHWVFLLFYEVMILYIREGDKTKRVLQNFHEYYETIINCLGDNVKKMYFLKN
jgi:transposase